MNIRKPVDYSEMYAALDYVMEKYNLSLGEYKYLAEFYGLEGW